MINRVRRIINDRKGEIKEKIIKFLEKYWKNTETQMGVSNTYKRKLVRENTWDSENQIHHRCDTCKD
mgnify:CR=1 FL=1